jgi:hypothetical protein
MRSATKFRIPPISRSISPRFQPKILTTFRSRPPPISSFSPSSFTSPLRSLNRAFSSTSLQRKKDYADQAKELHQKSADKHEDEFNSQIDDAIGQAKELQTRTPWHREGSDKPPVKRMRSAGAMTKGPSSSSPFPPPQDPHPTSIPQANMKLFCRQTPHNSLPPPKTNPPPDNPRQERGPKIHRTPRPPRPPPTTTLLPRTPNPIRTPHDKGQRRQ